MNAAILKPLPQSDLVVLRIENIRRQLLNIFLARVIVQNLVNHHVIKHSVQLHSKLLRLLYRPQTDPRKWWKTSGGSRMWRREVDRRSVT